MEAKCQYCGSKMESLLNTLEEEVTEIPNMTSEAENTIFVAVAGLKQVCVCVCVRACVLACVCVCACKKDCLFNRPIAPLVTRASVAQWLEQWVGTPKVVGSIPA